MQVCRVKITFTKLLTNHFVSTTKKWMKCVVNWFPRWFEKYPTPPYDDYTPPPNVMYSRFWYAFSMLKLTKFPPPYGGGLTFYYPSHDMNRFIPHVHRARHLNGFENSLNLAENRIENVLLTTWDGNSIFFSANLALLRHRIYCWPGPLPLIFFFGLESTQLKET